MSDSPQLEDGYVKIANEIYDALARVRIPGETRQVFDYIIRKTYGWNKKDDRIPLSQFVDGTGLSKVAVCKAIVMLKKMNLIVTKKGNTITQYGNDDITSYSINKHYGTWKPLPKKVMLPNSVITVTQKGNNPLPNLVHSKDTITKDTTKDKEPICAQPKRTVSRFEEFWNLYPKVKRKGRGACERKWGIIIKAHGASFADVIIDGLKKQIGTKNLDSRENYQYCPLPLTWLNQGRWADEITLSDRKKRNILWR
jgi:phage replication O-like protein O